MENKASTVEMLLNLPKKRPVGGLSTFRPKTTLERGHSIACAKLNSLDWLPYQRCIPDDAKGVGASALVIQRNTSERTA